LAKPKRDGLADFLGDSAKPEPKPKKRVRPRAQLTVELDADLLRRIHRAVADEKFSDEEDAARSIRELIEQAAAAWLDARGY
jgi:hypothetical protein